MQKTSRFLSIVTLFFILPVLLSSCGGGDTIIDAGSEQSAVAPLYSTNGANWNDYVKNDGADRFSASDTACNPATDTSCLHSGQMMMMEVPGYASCDGLTAYDSLQAFEWVCDDSVNPARFISTGFKPDEGLSDLIDFNNAAFKDNYLAVWEAGRIVVASSPSTWWSNTIVVANNGGSVTNSGEINIVTQNANAIYSIGADRVALVIRPGVVLTGSATTNETVVSATSRNFIWVEGVIDAEGDNYALNFFATSFSGINKVSALNAGTSGVNLSFSSNNNSLSNITASGSYFGVSLEFASNNNSLSNITASGNIQAGVYLNSASNNSLSNIAASGSYFGVNLEFASNNNSLSNITASGNIQSGVNLFSASNNSLSNITASGSYFGVYLNSASNNSLSNITASGNIQSGVNLFSASNNSLSNITASGNQYYGIYLKYASNNTFTGELQVGDNMSGHCLITGGTDPGLVDGTCSDTGLDGSNTYGTNSSDAILATGVWATGSFVDPINGDYSLLASDTIIRDVLAAPTGYDTYIHTWSDSTTTEMLRNAVEIHDDGLGNDNMICETNETCLFTPNIAAYQGHGDLVSVGTFSDGTITGVTLLRYETNGVAP